MDYQIWCGPAMGAFNQWVKGSFLASHENRHADVVALNLLLGACIATRVSISNCQGISLPREVGTFSPMEKSEILPLIEN